ncbi:MAG: hypothetical protein IPO83_04400 [Chitinophagaceae bacterium]|nr:hypothetical protein [Chitinophagaceae bacterium]
MNGKIWVAKNHEVMAMDTATGDYEIFGESDFPSFDYGDFVSIASNDVDCIYVSYMGCQNQMKGLLKFDGVIWQNFPCDLLNAIGWAGMPLQVASTGHVFTAVTNQVAEFDGQNWSIHTSPIGNIYCGGMDEADSIWMGTIGSGNLISYYEESFELVLNSSPAFYTMAVSKQGSAYIPSWPNSAGAIIKFNHGSLDTFDFPWSQFSTYVSPMTTDTSGNVIMVNGNAVYFLQGQDWIPHYFPVNFGEHTAVYCDPSNNVWIGYSNGMLVRLHEGQSTIFSLSYSSLPSDTVLSISSYQPGSDFQTVAGTTKGLAIIDNDNLAVKAVFDHNNSILQSDRITCLSKSSYFSPISSQWIGTNTGLYSWDFDTTWRRYSIDNSPLPNDTINSVVLGDYNGGVWIGTNAGLAYFDEDTSWTMYTTSNSPLPSNKIQCLQYYAQVLYAGTDSGVVIYDGSTWRILNTTNSGISANDIIAIARTYNALFIGTRANGLCDSSFVSSNWTYLNSGNGLGSDSILTIYSSASGGWAGSNGVFVGTKGAGMYTVYPDGTYNDVMEVQGIGFENAYDASENTGYWSFQWWVGTEKGILYSDIYGGIYASINQSHNAVVYFDPTMLNIRADWSQFVSPEIQVFDLQGRFLFSYHPGRLIDQQVVRIPTARLSSQIYVIRILSGNSSIALKAIKPE